LNSFSITRTFPSAAIIVIRPPEILPKTTPILKYKYNDEFLVGGIIVPMTFEEEVHALVPED
ncbi:5054_t:CDS:2, partial [Funneliformis caledonium]